jgi:hypothetical protein
MNEAKIAAAPGRLDLFRLASIFIGLRLRTMRNAFRVRQRGRSALLVTIIGLVVGFAYVTLFAQAFSIIAHTVGFDGQLAALAVVTGTIAFGSLAARAASSEAVRAGSPENEFLLARPLSLATMVAARGLADAVTDPVGALFLLPVLIAATHVWNLGPAAWLIAAVISLLMQVGISMLAYATQLAIVRWIPGPRRRGVWTGLRLVAALSLAMLWLLGTSVMRAPAALAAAVGALAPKLAFLPSMLVGAPLGALARGAPGQAALALLGLIVAVGATVLLVMVVAGRAGMAGWEEAGAIWAEATSMPRPTARPVTAATKDLRLITRERSQLLALIAMPVIFVGVQVFGAAGWDWMTAGVDRISWLSYSLALYMCTIGPLTHMQAERRAFWILRTVPVPLSHLLAGKARAWSVIVGGIAALAFAVLCLSVPHASLVESLAAGLLVTAGAAGMSFVAVAMAAGGADLSDETATAVGPTTIYAFMFVGGLFNVVLTGEAATRIAGLALYGFAAWTYWQTGVEQASFCLDAEAVRARRVRASDGATMLIIYALGGRAVAKISSLGGGASMAKGILLAQGLLLAAIGIAVAVYLARRPAPTGRRGGMASLALAAGAGACGAAVLLATGGRAGSLSGGERGLVVMLALVTLPEEAILRGVVQRALPVPRLIAAAISAIVGVVSASLAGVSFSTGTAAIVALIVSHVCGALVYALTGRVTAAWISRVVTVGVAAFV